MVFMEMNYGVQMGLLILCLILRTANGTYLVKDIVPGPSSSYPTGFVGTKTGIAYFYTYSYPDYILFQTDGTPAGRKNENV